MRRFANLSKISKSTQISKNEAKTALQWLLRSCMAVPLACGVVLAILTDDGELSNRSRHLKAMDKVERARSAWQPPLLLKPFTILMSLVTGDNAPADLTHPNLTLHTQWWSIDRDNDVRRAFDLLEAKVSGSGGMAARIPTFAEQHRSALDGGASGGIHPVSTRNWTQCASRNSPVRTRPPPGWRAPCSVGATGTLPVSLLETRSTLSRG